VIRTSVLQVIASNRSDHHVPQPHSSCRFGNACGLVGFERKWLGGIHCAKATRPSAAISTDHEGSRALGPTFPMVGAHCALANRVQLQLVQQCASMSEAIRGRQSNAQPLREARSWFEIS
jgi:hypothetical protein